MKTLTIEHIAPYLPYRLKMIFEGKGGRVIELTGITNHDKFGASITGGTGAMWLNSCGFKPLLRPLSDLTKPINHKGETFYPCVELQRLFQGTGFSFQEIEYNEWQNIYLHFGDHSTGYSLNLKAMPIIRKLYEWHFDLDSLIENGLAIDLNTLEG